MATFRQGDTTTITMTSSDSLEGKKLKAGIYTLTGKPLFETVYPDDGEILKVDSTHFTLVLGHEVTKRFIGSNTLRLTVYTEDKEYVNAGENAVPLQWSAEPVNKDLK